MRCALLLLLIPASCPADDVSDLARDMLAAHNAARAKVNVKPLAWSADLARRAQEWANTLLESKQFSHPKKGFVRPEPLRDARRAGDAAKVVETWAAEAGGLRLREESLQRPVRPLHTSGVVRDSRDRLRRGAERIARGLGVRLQSAGQLYRPPAVLTGSQSATATARTSEKKLTNASAALAIWHIPSGRDTSASQCVLARSRLGMRSEEAGPKASGRDACVLQPKLIDRVDTDPVNGLHAQQPEECDSGQPECRQTSGTLAAGVRVSPAARPVH